MTYGKTWHEGRTVRHHNLVTATQPNITGPINKGKGRSNTAGKGQGRGNNSGALAPFDGVVVYLSAQQSATASTANAIDFDLELYDYGNWHKPNPNPSRLIAPSAGLIRVYSGFHDENAVGASSITQQVNGGSVRGLGLSYSGGTQGDQASNLASALISASAGDYFEVIHEADANCNIDNTGSTFGGAELVTDVSSYALVGKSAGQSISAATNTNLTWDEETADTDAFHDNVTNNSRLTVPANGVYRIGCNLDVATNNSQAVLELKLDGSTGAIGFGGRDVEYNGVKGVQHWSAPVVLTAGQYAEVNFFSNLATTINATDYSWFTIEEVPASYGRALVYKTSGQSISNDAHTPVTFDSESYDTDGFHSTVSNTSRLTVPAGFTHARLSFFGAGDAAAAAQKVFTIYKNGVAVPNTSFIGAARHDSQTTGFDLCSGMSPWLPVSEGDYFELDAYGQTGFTVQGTSPYQTWFAIEVR